MKQQAMAGYQKLLQTGELEQRAAALLGLASSCCLCPWRCGVNRLKNEKGRCRAGAVLRVAKALPHFGEEPVLTGAKGSGTVFFSHCNLQCCFCQNWQISHEALGEDMTVEQLAGTMRRLQDEGCHNINLVSASHYMPWIVQALELAAAGGLTLPIVYNSNGYEAVEMLRLLEGIIDIYVPDAKYGEDAPAQKYSAATDYCRINAAALDEMLRQTGLLECDDSGLARRGLIVRHLVLPGGIAGTRAVLERLRQACGRRIAVSLMGQYRPCYRAAEHAGLEQPLAPTEYALAVAILEELGFENGWTQVQEAIDGSFVPDFRKETWS
jgi:putative pyruvate formate lyase activating enzyme